MKSLKKWFKRFGVLTLIGVAIAIVVAIVLMLWWDEEPEPFTDSDVQKLLPAEPIIGEASIMVMIKQIDILLDKPGGFIRNDTVPPSMFMDNMAEWELGAVHMTRDFALVMRNEISRAQSHSIENDDLTKAQNLLANDMDKWMLPAPETKLKQAKEFYQSYLRDIKAGNAQFYARADNLNDWLDLVEKRLDGYTNILAASHQKTRVNTDLAGDSHAEQSTVQSSNVIVETSFMELDNNLKEARGFCNFLIGNLRAIRIDFENVLKDKTALISLDQIINQLEYTQETLWVPWVWGGGGMSLISNPSLVTSGYVSRASKGILKLKILISDG